MVSKEDWNAAMSSEIFREYLGNELAKEANSKPIEPSENDVRQEFLKFQEMVLETPHMKTAFKKLQDKFLTDSEYASNINPDFVKGVLALDLTGEQK